MANNSSALNGLPDFDIYIWPIGVEFIFGGLAAIFGNAMITLALTTNKELKKNRCNILVTNLAVADLVTSFWFIICGIIALLANIKGIAYVAMSNELCFYLMIPVIICLDSAAITILAIGFDRMVSLIKPIYYKNLTTKYMFVIIASSWLFGLANALVGWIEKDPKIIVPTCAPPTALNGSALAFWADSSVVINILVIIAYSIAYTKAKRLAKFRTNTNEQALRNNRLLKSLVIFVCVYVTCFGITYVVVALSNIVPMSPSLSFHLAMYVGILSNITVTCNFYIYYAQSDEYRKAFKKILGMKIPTNGTQQSQSNRSLKLADQIPPVNGVEK